MYVCLCHGFTDRQVRSAIEEGGAGTTSAVYKHLQCAPRCGKCVPTVRDMVGGGTAGGCGGNGGKCGCK
ncbi:MAG: bacterioferritin-associated ferredoxin [Solirubrobacterales bacterium]